MANAGHKVIWLPRRNAELFKKLLLANIYSFQIVCFVVLTAVAIGGKSVSHSKILNNVRENNYKNSIIGRDTNISTWLFRASCCKQSYIEGGKFQFLKNGLLQYSCPNSYKLPTVVCVALELANSMGTNQVNPCKN